MQTELVVPVSQVCLPHQLSSLLHSSFSVDQKISPNNAKLSLQEEEKIIIKLL